MVSYFHHLVSGTKVSSFITFHHISSPSWWHEDEFLFHLVGGMNGKLPNDIRVRVVHFITWLVAYWWHEGEYGLYISSSSWWHEDEFLLHLVGGMSGKLPNDIRVWVVHFIT